MSTYTGSHSADIKTESGTITIGCMSHEASDLLDTAMTQWKDRWANLPEDQRIADPEDVYGFAYWLVRWSWLVQPAERENGNG